MTSGDPEGHHFLLIETFNSHMSRNIARINYNYVYKWTGKCTSLVIAIVLSKLKDFSRSQAVTYTVTVVITQKRCKTTVLLLQTTNRKWHMAYWMAAIPVSLSDLLVTHLLQSFLNGIFLYSCAAGDKISTT